MIVGSAFVEVLPLVPPEFEKELATQVKASSDAVAAANPQLWSPLTAGATAAEHDVTTSMQGIQGATSDMATHATAAVRGAEVGITSSLDNVAGESRKLSGAALQTGDDVGAAWARTATKTEAEQEKMRQSVGRTSSVFDAFATKVGGMLTTLGNGAASLGVPFSKNIQRAGQDMEEAGKKGEGASKGIGELGRAASGYGAVALLGLGAASLHMAGNFQEAMTQLVTGAGESEDAIGLVSKGILDMAVSVGTSSTALAQGMYLIESAGFHGAQGLEVLKAAAEGAKTGNADLSVVGNAVTTVLNAYGLSADKATSVTSGLIETVASGKTHLQDLAGALASVLPVAAATHISFAQVGGALATLTSQGVDAAESSQMLANFIRSMQAPSQGAVHELEQLGLSSTDVSTHLGSRGLTGTIDLLVQTITAHMGPAGLLIEDAFKKSQAAAADAREELSKLPASLVPLAQRFLEGTITQSEWRKSIRGLPVDQAQLAREFGSTASAARGFNDTLKSADPQQTFAKALTTITGGATGMNTVLDLTGAHLGAFKTNVENVGASMTGTGKTVQGFGEVQKDFNFQLSQARVEVEKMGIQLGQKLMPIVESVISFIGKHQTAVRDVAIAIGVTLVAAFAAAAVAALSFWTVATAGIALAVLAIAAGITWIVTHFTEVKEFLKRWSLEIAAALVVVLGPFGLLLGAALLIWSHWKVIWSDMKVAVRDFVGFFTAIPGEVVKGWDAVVDFFTRLPGRIWRELQALPGQLVDFFAKLPGRIVSAITAAASGLLSVGRTIVDGILYGLGVAASALWDFFKDLGPKILAVLGAGAAAFLRIGGWIVDHVVSGLSGLADAVGRGLGSLAATVGRFFERVPGYILDALKALPDLLLNFLLNLFITWPILLVRKSIDLGIVIVRGIVQGLIAAVPAILSFVISLPGRIIDVLTTVVPVLFRVGAMIVSHIVSGLLTAASAVFFFFLHLPERIIDVLTTVVPTLFRVGATIISSIVSGLGDAVVAIWNFFIGIPGDIVGLFSGSGGGKTKGAPTGGQTQLHKAGKSIIESILSGLGEAVVAIFSWFAQLPGKILDHIAAGTGKKFNHWAAGVAHDILDGFGDAFGAVTGFFGDIWAAIAQPLIDVWNVAYTVIHAVWTGIRDFLTVEWKVFSTTARVIWAIVYDVIMLVWHTLDTGVRRIWDALRDFLTAAWRAFVDVARTVWSPISAAVLAVWHVLDAGVRAVWNALKAFLTLEWNGFVTVARTVWNLVSGAVMVVWHALDTAVRAVWNALKGFLTTEWRGFVTVVTTLWNPIKDAVMVVWHALDAAVRAVWHGLKSFFTTEWNGFVTIATNLWNLIKDAVVAVWNALDAAIRAVWHALKTFLTTEWNGFVDIATNLWNAITGAVTTVWHALDTSVRAVWNGLKTFLTSEWNAFVGVVTGIWNTITGAITTAFDVLPGAFASIWDTVRNAFVDGVNLVIGVINFFIGLLQDIPGVKGAGLNKIQPLGKGGGSGGGPAGARATTAGLEAGGMWEGGLVHSPTILVGEGGRGYPEVIIPTDPLYRSNALRLLGQAQELIGGPQAALGSWWKPADATAAVARAFAGAAWDPMAGVPRAAHGHWWDPIDVAKAAIKGVGNLAVGAFGPLGHLVGGLGHWVLGHIVAPMVQPLVDAAVKGVSVAPEPIAGIAVTAIHALANWLLGQKAAATPGTAPGGAARAPSSGVPAANAAAAMQMAAGAPWGWSGAEWVALNNVAMAESGWSMTAQNPTSNAYGIAQFINGPAEYAQWGGNATTLVGQLTGFFNYIRSRYTDPIGAWAHELAFHWYDQGGMLPTGLSLALNTTGRPEPVGAPRGGVTIEAGAVQVQVTVGGGMDPATVRAAVDEGIGDALSRVLAVAEARNPSGRTL